MFPFISLCSRFLPPWPFQNNLLSRMHSLSYESCGGALLDWRCSHENQGSRCKNHGEISLCSAGLPPHINLHLLANTQIQIWDNFSKPALISASPPALQNPPPQLHSKAVFLCIHSYSLFFCDREKHPLFVAISCRGASLSLGSKVNRVYQRQNWVLWTVWGRYDWMFPEKMAKVQPLLPRLMIKVKVVFIIKKKGGKKSHNVYFHRVCVCVSKRWCMYCRKDKNLFYTCEYECMCVFSSLVPDT